MWVFYMWRFCPKIVVHGARSGSYLDIGKESPPPKSAARLRFGIGGRLGFGGRRLPPLVGDLNLPARVDGLGAALLARRPLAVRATCSRQTKWLLVTIIQNYVITRKAERFLASQLYRKNGFL